MDRRQEIERIVLGTILNSSKENDYMANCRCCITADMFDTEQHQEIYKTALQLKSAGMDEVSPFTVWSANQSLAPEYLCELADEWYFELKKYLYNRQVYYFDTKRNKRYTRVTFDDYINRFMELVFSNGERNSSTRRSAEPAA